MIVIMVSTRRKFWFWLFTCLVAANAITMLAASSRGHGFFGSREQRMPIYTVGYVTNSLSKAVYSPGPAEGMNSIRVSSVKQYSGFLFPLTYSWKLVVIDSQLEETDTNRIVAQWMKSGDAPDPWVHMVTGGTRIRWLGLVSTVLMLMLCILMKHIIV